MLGERLQIHSFHTPKLANEKIGRASLQYNEDYDIGYPICWRAFLHFAPGLRNGVERPVAGSNCYLVTRDDTPPLVALRADMALVELSTRLHVAVNW